MDTTNSPLSGRRRCNAHKRWAPMREKVAGGPAPYNEPRGFRYARPVLRWSWVLNRWMLMGSDRG